MSRLLLPDLLRTIALVMMVIYHTAFDLTYVWGFDLPIFQGGWWLLARSSAAMFLLTSGLTDAIPRKHRDGRRFFLLAGCAALVSLATIPLAHDAFIKFGILHLMALASIMLIPFRELPAILTGLIGVVIIGIGIWIGTPLTDIPWLFPFGFIRSDFVSLDFFPIFPWFGWILLGRSIAAPLLSAWPKRYNEDSRTGCFLFVGRHSLLIYLIHQPLLFIVLALLLGKPLAS